MKKIFLLSLFALCSFPSLFSQVTTSGKNFWASIGRNFAHNDPGEEALSFQIRIVASKATTVTVTFTANTALNFTVFIAAGQIYTKNLTVAEKTALYSWDTGVTSKSLHVTSSEDVSVYILNQAVATTDATNLLPVNTLGTDYYHISYLSLPGYSDGYTIVAVENGTTIYEDGGILKATLAAGQVYSDYSNADITGKHITSNNPIAYFVTSQGVNIPYGISYGDCMYQQLVPVNSWGTHFLVPISKRGKERIRIVASLDGTTITQSGGTIQTGLGAASLSLNAGQFVELEASLTGGGCYISADKPVGVCALMVGSSYSELTSADGDPALAWVPPIEQSVKSSLIAPFVPTAETQLTEHYALIVTPTATRAQTTVSIGGGSVTALSGGTWTTGNGVIGSIYSFYSLPLTNLTNSYNFANENGLTVMGYGLGQHESYYYLAASASRNLYPAFYVNEEHYQDIDGHTYCNSQFQIHGLVVNANTPIPGYLRWYINGVEETAARDMLDWNKTLAPGTYTIEMSVLDLQSVAHSIHSTITVGTCIVYLPVNKHVRVGINATVYELNGGNPVTY
jgi:hypothetical protein